MGWGTREEEKGKETNEIGKRTKKIIRGQKTKKKGHGKWEKEEAGGKEQQVMATGKGQGEHEPEIRVRR